MVTTRRAAAAAVMAVLLVALPQGPAAGDALFGTRGRPLAGPRHDLVSALARHLDETARGALEGATDDARRGGRTSARFLSSIRDFGRRAHALRVSVDGYPARPFEVPAEVADLTLRARGVIDRLRAAPAMEGTFDDWEAILDTLERIRIVLAGGDVEVPTAHLSAPLSGPGLEELRGLARDLER